jgi:hypothetical protein
VEFAADALAFFFLRAQQVGGEFNDASFTFPKCVVEAGFLDGECGTFRDGGEEFFFGGKPVVRFVEADDQDANDLIADAERHSPERLGFLAEDGIQSSVRMIEVGQNGGLASEGHLARKPNANGHFQGGVQFESEGSLRTQAVVIRIAQQHQAEGGSEGVGGNAKDFVEQGGKVGGGEFGVEYR